MRLEEIRKAKEDHPEALVLTHPECPGEVLELSDYIGSTSGIIEYAQKSNASEFIICTENGVRYELENDVLIRNFILQRQNLSARI